MSDFNEETTIVIRKLIPDDQRMSHTARLFGAHFAVVIEPVVYASTGKMAKDYHGGFWRFWHLDNGGFYMSIDGDQVYQVSCDNYFTGQLSADALGITACLYAYSHLSFSKDKMFGRLCAQNYHLLRAYMFEHPEVASILRAID